MAQNWLLNAPGTQHCPCICIITKRTRHIFSCNSSVCGEHYQTVRLFRVTPVGPLNTVYIQAAGAGPSSGTQVRILLTYVAAT